jgi:hypothetical protein
MHEHTMLVMDAKIDKQKLDIDVLQFKHNHSLDMWKQYEAKYTEAQAFIDASHYQLQSNIKLNQHLRSRINNMESSVD